MLSVYLYGTVNLTDKVVGGKESDGSGEKPKRSNHETGVGKVEESRHEFGDFQLK